MSWLTTLIFGAAVTGSAIKCGLQNIDSLSKPQYIYKDGTAVYLDRKGRKYINGEPVYEKVEYDRYHNRHCYLIGERTGTLYHDSYSDVIDRQKKEEKEEIEHQKKLGKLAYRKYYPECQRELTTEMSTGKIIARLEIDKYGVCRKYYAVSPKYYYKEEDEEGIEISREELDALNIGCGRSHYFSDISDPIYIEMYRRRNSWYW